MDPPRTFVLGRKLGAGRKWLHHAGCNRSLQFDRLWAKLAQYSKDDLSQDKQQRPMIYQLDVRTRHEQMPRVLRNLRIDIKEVAEQGAPSPHPHFDESRPWNYVLRKVLDDSGWWWSELKIELFGGCENYHSQSAPGP